MEKYTGFLKEVWEELGKVTWLPRKDVVRSTIGVSVVVILISIYISVVDFDLTAVLKSILGGR